MTLKKAKNLGTFPLQSLPGSLKKLFVNDVTPEMVESDTTALGKVTSVQAGKGVKKYPNSYDVICEWPLIVLSQKVVKNARFSWNKFKE